MIKVVFELENKRAVAYDGRNEVGECDFIEEGNSWNIIHTGVRVTHQGKGIARKLVECVILNANKNNKKVIAKCSYAKKVLENEN